MDAVEEVKGRLAIEDVIGEYVQLKRAGRNWKGLSPFSNERTPSFIVSPEKQIWHDFSSGKGGDLFSFVMEMEGLDFRQTLELLARKAGVDLEQFRGSHSSGNAKLKERLFEALELATKFYQVQFSRNTTALEYVFNKRRFTKDTALAWQLGYAPNNGAALADFLKSKKFTEAEIKGAGLSSRSYRGEPQDMFRGRLMVPLADGQGRVIGFTARLLTDDPNAPKYINTPQTALYDKSRHMFGLHLAKDAIRKEKYVVLTEGNLDVIMSHQAGVRQVVATAGTALTEWQLKALGRFTPDIRLSFDADQAGASATERAIPIASRVGVSLSVIDIPSGKDPDELIKQDSAVWQEIISRPKYALDWLIDRYKKSLDLSGAQGKRQFSDVLLPVVQRLNDSVEQDHYLSEIAKIIEVSKSALVEKMHKNTAPKPQLRRRKVEVPQLDKRAVDMARREDHLLALALLSPPLRKSLKLVTADMFGREDAKALYEFLQAHPDFSAATEFKEVQNLTDYANILVLQYEELYRDDELLELKNEAARLQSEIVKNFVKIENQKLAAQIEGADGEQRQQLLTRVNLNNALLRTVGGTNG